MEWVVESMKIYSYDPRIQRVEGWIQRVEGSMRIYSYDPRIQMVEGWMERVVGSMKIYSWGKEELEWPSGVGMMTAEELVVGPQDLKPPGAASARVDCDDGVRALLRLNTTLIR